MANFTAGYDRLKRLFQKVQGVNWQEKIQALAKLSQGSNLLEIRTIVKGLCEEIAQHARVANDCQTTRMLSEFLACLGHSSNAVKEHLSQIQLINDKAQKHQALLQLLLSNDIQHALAEQLKVYLSQDTSPMSHAYKHHSLNKALEQTMTRCLDDITVLNNQASYDDTGRIVKRLMDLLKLLFDVLLVNFGFKPTFAEDLQEGSGRKPQAIMPMPMKM